MSDYADAAVAYGPLSDRNSRLTYDRFVKAIETEVAMDKFARAIEAGAGSPGVEEA